MAYTYASINLRVCFRIWPATPSASPFLEMAASRDAVEWPRGGNGVDERGVVGNGLKFLVFEDLDT